MFTFNLRIPNKKLASHELAGIMARSEIIT